MAIYHCAAKVISRSAGRSAVAAAAYRAGANLYDERLEAEHCYANKKGVVHSEIMAPPDVPAWVLERQSLWNAVEASEKRRDSQLARDFDLALPVELSLPQRLDLVRGFVQEQLVDRGMVADFSIHQDNAKNPHVHIMTTMRTIDTNGFGKKERQWNEKELLKSQRTAWATHVNRALENAGQQTRVDHRCLAAQAVTDRLPQIHLGVAATGMLERAAVQAVVLEHPRLKRFHARQQFNDSVVLLNREIAEETARLAAAQQQEMARQHQAQQQRESWGRAMAAVATESMRYARKVKKIEVAEHIEEGERYRVIQDGQTLKLVAMDERGLLVEFQGDQITFISEHLTEVDHQHFQAQRQKLEELQKPQPQAQTPPKAKKSKGVDWER